MKEPLNAMSSDMQKRGMELYVSGKPTESIADSLIKEFPLIGTTVVGAFVETLNKADWKRGRPVLLQDLPEYQIINWIWNGYAAPGLLTLLSGQAKTGKSTFVRGFLRAALKGGPYCGSHVKDTSVLYMSEESDSQWAEFRETLDNADGNLHLLTRSNRKWRPRSLEGLRPWARDYAGDCRRKGIELVVIDPISRILQVENENDNSEVLQALGCLDEFTGLGIGVIAIHHIGKNKQGPRGASAFQQEPDILLSFSRPNEEDDSTVSEESRSVRVIKGEGRSDAVPGKTIVEFDGENYRLIKAETYQGAKVIQRRNRLVEIIGERNGTTEYIDATGIIDTAMREGLGKERTIRTDLMKLTEAHQIHQEPGSGRRAARYRILDVDVVVPGIGLSAKSTPL